MCYSKEVSLLAGGIISSGSGYAWWKYCAHKVQSFTVKKELIPFYKNVIFGFMCIAMHQIFEYFAISTGNFIIYKAGLLWSISCMYFLIKSLEALTNMKFGSNVFAVIIAFIGLDMFTREMTFADKHFWVSGDSHFLWAAAWMLLFIYWNICILYIRRMCDSAKDKKYLLMYPFFVLNISFFVALAYGYGSAYVQHSGNFLQFFSVGVRNAMLSFSVLKDSPSIWCVFSSMHAIFIPILFAYMNKNFDPDLHLRIKRVTTMTEVKIISLDVALFIILYFTLPIFPGIAFKMLFK